MKVIRETSFCTVLASSFLLWLGTSLCSFLNCEYQCHQTPFGGECFCPPSHIININDSRTCTGKGSEEPQVFPQSVPVGLQTLRPGQFQSWGFSEVTSPAWLVTCTGSPPDFCFWVSVNTMGLVFSEKVCPSWFSFYFSFHTSSRPLLVFFRTPFLPFHNTPSPTHSLRFITFQIHSCTCMWT